MSRHRGLKDLIDDYDETEDFDPMDDDESSPDFYIAQVVAKTGAMPKAKVLKALDSVDWDVPAAVRLLKSQAQPKPPPNNNNKNNKPPQAKPNPQAKAPANSPQIKQQNPRPPATSSASTPKLQTQISKSSSVSSSTTKSPSLTSNPSTEETKAPPSTHALLNQDYPDVNSEV